MKTMAAGRKAIEEREMMAVSPHRPRLSPERRRALKLLASGRHGVNEELLVRGHGFSRAVLASLVLRGLAAAEHEVMIAGGKAMEVVRVRITEAGRRAIEG
jgi:hypothetical protein